ncbi:hypothetical protein STIAU_6809, partial [Stigmatella aurantiaca DW4/3-1]
MGSMYPVSMGLPTVQPRELKSFEVQS